MATSDHHLGEDLLLALLNTAPIDDGHRRELLDGPVAKRWGGTGSATEVGRLRRMRDALQAVIRGEPDSDQRLAVLLTPATRVPRVHPDGIEWELQAPRAELPALRVAEAWSQVATRRPGRLRACANTGCNLFLLDRSRPGTARWCSMAICGNRAKARAHAARVRAAGD